MIDPYSPPSSSTSEPLLDLDDAWEQREALLNYEAAVLGLGWWFYFMGLSQLLMGVMTTLLVGTIFIMTSPVPGHLFPIILVMMLVGVLSLGLGGLCTYSAWGVRSGAPESRLPALVSSGIMLLNVPFGMIAGAAGLYLLLLPESKAFFTHQHAHIRAATDDLKAPWHPLLLALPVTIVLTVLVSVGLLGYSVLLG